MALNFSCNQYQQAFDSKRLQNWNVPHRHRKQPVAYDGFTQIIASNRGHLLPGVPRSTRSPWGTYVGTWDYPKQIPGTKLLDPMARRKDAYYQNVERRSSGQAIILGRLKVRRAQAGTYEDILNDNIVTQQEVLDEVRSQRSGAFNPLAKGQPSVGAEAAAKYLSPATYNPERAQGEAKPFSAGLNARQSVGTPKALSPMHIASEMTSKPRSAVGAGLHLSKEPPRTPTARLFDTDVTRTSKPPSPSMALGETRLSSPTAPTPKAFSPVV